MGITISHSPSPNTQRYHEQRNHRHKQLTDWARQMVQQVRRWLPTRAIVVVADSSFAALELLSALGQMSKPVHIITRLRLDAQLYQLFPASSPQSNGPSPEGGQAIAWSKSAGE